MYVCRFYNFVQFPSQKSDLWDLRGEEKLWKWYFKGLEFRKETGIVKVGARVVLLLSALVILGFISNGISRSCTELQLRDEFLT